jgi:hypothetical protein
LILTIHKKILTFRVLKHLNVNLRFIERTLKRYKKTDQVQPKKKTGKKLNVIKKVSERFRRKGSE